MNLPLMARIRVGASLLAVYWLLLFIATHVPNSNLLLPLNFWDKAQHFGAYLVLALLASVVVRQFPLSLPVRYLVVFALVGIYGAVDEWLQHFVPGRQPDLLDFTADILGATLGIVLHLALTGLLARRKLRRAMLQQSTDA